MKITDLKYVIEAAEAGSISAAAKNLYVAQPNISKAIKSMEAEYGITLFTRSSKGVVPTREGQIFIQRAKSIIREIEQLDGQFLPVSHQKAELKISIPRASYASYAFVQYMRKIKDAEEIKVHIKECNSLEALNHILKDQYHLALIRYETQYEEYYQAMIRLKDLECETLMEFQYALLVSEQSPLATKEIGGYGDLDGYIELLHGDTRLPNGDYVDSMEVPANVNPRKRIHVYERGSQFALLQGIPEAYMWVSPMPQEVLDNYHLIQKECSWQERTLKDVLVYPSRRFLREEDKAFMEELKKEIHIVSDSL